MSEKLELACKCCNKISKEPIELPCGLVICNEHTNNLNYFNCPSCSNEHTVPQRGFEKKCNLQKRIEDEDYLNDQEKRLKSICCNTFVQLLNLLEDFKLKANEFEYCNHEFFAELKRKIEIHREELKLKIDDISQEFICKVTEKEREFVKESEKNDIHGVREIIKQENNELIENFRSLDVSIETIKNLETKQKRRLEEIHDKIAKFDDIQFEFEKYQFKGNFDLDHADFGILKKRDDILVMVYDGNKCKLWNPESKSFVNALELREKEIKFGITFFKIIKQSDLMLTHCNDGLFRIFELKTGMCSSSFGETNNQIQLNATNKIKLISKKQVAISVKSQIKVYNIETGLLDKCFTIDVDPEEPVRILTILKNRDILFSIYENDYEIKLLDYSSGNIKLTFSDFQYSIKRVQGLKNGLFASGSIGEIKIYDFESGVCVKTLTEEFGILIDFDLMENGNLVCSNEKMIRIFDASNLFECIITIVCPCRVLSIKSCSKDKLATICTDESVLIYDLNTSEWFSNLDVEENSHLIGL